MRNNWIEKLENQNACAKGLSWASKQESPQEAWSACERGDWMLWAWGKNCGRNGSESHRKLVLCCVEIAKTSLKCIKDKKFNKVVKKSLDTTERWAKGENSVTLKDVKKDRIAATVADTAANAAWSAAHADAAAYAAWSAANAADAAVYAAYAARSAAWYAGGGVWSVPKEKKLKECADIIRKMQPDCPKFKTA